MTEDMSRAKARVIAVHQMWVEGESGAIHEPLFNEDGVRTKWEKVADNWIDAASRLSAEPKVEPVETDKSEGVNKTAFAAPPDPPELVIDEKFTLWRDEEGDYIIQATERQQRGHFLVADGRTPEDAVWRMRQMLEMSDAMDPKEAEGGGDERPIAYKCRSCNMTLTEKEFAGWVGCDVCEGDGLIKVEPKEAEMTHEQEELLSEGMTVSYSHCPTCGQQFIGGQAICRHRNYRTLTEIPQSIANRYYLLGLHYAGPKHPEPCAPPYQPMEESNGN